jgi:hypothetical protein
VRWFLALALVLHFTGLPAVGGMVCSASTAGEHSCCEDDSPAQPGDRVSAHCGCAMAPGGPAEHRRPLGVAPESRDTDAAGPVHHAGLGGDPIRRGQAARDVTPPVSPATAFLSGTGFRC